MLVRGDEAVNIQRGHKLPVIDVWDLAVPLGAAAKGAGGGEVYKATTRSTGETVAVKFTHLKDGTAEARLLQRAGERTEHLPRIYGFDKHGDQAVLVMQWGGAAIPERPHPAGLCAALVVSALRGIEALHALGRIHSDIHHHNVIANAELDPKSVLVIDAANSRTLTQGRWRGENYWSDPQFMAPELQTERKKGELLDIDKTVDLFAAGSLLVRYLTGKPTFVRRQTDGLGLRDAIRRGPRLPRTIDRGLAAVITKALAYEPADRFQSCAELIAALEPYAVSAVAANSDREALGQIMEIYYPRERKALDVALGEKGESVETYRKLATKQPVAELVADLRARALAAVEQLRSKDSREILAHYYGGLCMRMNVIGPPLSWNVYEANPDIGAHVDAARGFTLEQVRGAVTFRFDRLAEAMGRYAG